MSPFLFINIRPEAILILLSIVYILLLLYFPDPTLEIKHVSFCLMY